MDHASSDESRRATDEAALVARLAAGDSRTAPRELYARYSSPVYGIGLRLLGDRGLAEDVVQETFIRLWRAAPRFDPARGTVRTFVFTIARRTAVDFARRGSSRPAGIGMDHASLEREAGADPRSGEEFDALLLGLELREAMSELSDSHREVLELSFDSDLSQAQIAQRLAVPLGTVKTRTYYGLKALRAVIEERGLL